MCTHSPPTSRKCDYSSSETYVVLIILHSAHKGIYLLNKKSLSFSSFIAYSTIVLSLKEQIPNKLQVILISQTTNCKYVCVLSDKMRRWDKKNFLLGPQILQRLPPKNGQPMFLITSFKTENKGRCGDVKVCYPTDLSRSSHYLLPNCGHIQSVLHKKLLSYNMIISPYLIKLYATKETIIYLKF